MVLLGKGAKVLAGDVDNLKAQQQAAAKSATALGEANKKAVPSVQEAVRQQQALGKAAKKKAGDIGLATRAMTKLEDANLQAVASMRELDLQMRIGELTLKNVTNQSRKLRLEMRQRQSAAELLVSTSRDQRDAFDGLEKKQQRAIATNRILGDVVRETYSRLKLPETFLRQDPSEVFERVEARIKSLSQLLAGPAKQAFDGLVESFRSGRLHAADFLRQTEAFTEPFTRFRTAVLAVANVLQGPFRIAADRYVVALEKGVINTRRFGTEILKLVKDQKRAALGFNELFRSIENVNKGFQSLSDSAKRARLELADRLRKGIGKLQKDFDEGRVTFKRYTKGLRIAGEEAKRFTDLTDSQLVVFNKFKDTNAVTAQLVLELAGSIDERLRPAFDSFIEAARVGKLSGLQLRTVLRDLQTEQAALAEVTKESAEANDEFADKMGKAGTSAADAAESIKDTATQVKNLADTTVAAATKTEQAANRIASSMQRISVMGGRPGGIQFERPSIRR